MKDCSAKTLAIISALIEDEWEAIKGYSDAIDQIQKMNIENADKIIDIINDISDEENLHVGQLESILKLIAPSAVKNQNKGSKEGDRQMASEEDDEIEWAEEFIN